MPDKADIYLGLRDQALQTPAHSLKFDDDAVPSKAFGLVTDWALDNGIATITAFLTGDASLYLSSGGGVIGGIAHGNVRIAAKSAVAIAAESLSALTSATEYPLPKPGHTRFTVLADGGNVSGEFDTEDLGTGNHALSALFFAVQELIGQLRLAK